MNVDIHISFLIMRMIMNVDYYYYYYDIIL
jgi:hypothetical protein